MSASSHPRVAAIRQVSRYFLWLTSGALLLTALGTLFVLLRLFLAPQGAAGINEVIANTIDFDQLAQLIDHGLTWPGKIAGMIYIVFLGGMTAVILIQLNQLLTCFDQGEIFNQKAIRHARKALRIYIVFSVASYFLQLYSMMNSELVGHFARRLMSEISSDLIWIGIALLVVWALEIGTALNEEVELTI